MHVPTQLLLRSRKLEPGEDWALPRKGWIFVRVRSGDTYLLGKQTSAACSAGQVAVSAGKALELRASRMGGAEFDWFQFDTSTVFGVLTFIERRRLEHPEEITPALPWVLTAGSEPGRLFTLAVSSASGVLPALEHRGRLLSLVSAAVGPRPALPPAESAYRRDALERLEELLNQLTDSELLRLTADELAAMCRCEKRRLLLLFREHFGDSLPGQRSEWMRLKACSLLAQPEASVQSVARECGYERPDAFRAWFRRQFGMAPAEWHRQRLAADNAASVKLQDRTGDDPVPV
jgi:AraC-like DNA-binding protein